MTHRSSKGFTLIETIIYIFLLMILIGGGVSSAFYIMDSSEKNKSDINVDAEAHFLLRKIDWALTGSTIIAPPPAFTDTSLEVNKGGVPIIIKLNSGRAQVNGVPITNDRINIPIIAFEHIDVIGAKPAAIHASFSINGKNYETTKYIRK